MASGRKKKKSAARPAEGATNPKEIMEALSAAARSGRASSEDTAEELSNALGGPKGIALIYKELIFHAKTQPSTKVKVLSSIMTFLERTANKYGDQARLNMMSKEQLEMTLCGLLIKHDFVVPIKGVQLNVEAKG